MWHDLNDVAQQHDFNKTVFINFAMENHDKYGIVSSIGSLGINAAVNNWHVDALVKDFKMSIVTNIVAEVEQENIHLIVSQKGNNLFDVIVDGDVRHPDCDNLAVMRAMAHYLNSYAYKASKLE